jgi:hypothetical protein
MAQFNNNFFFFFVFFFFNIVIMLITNFWNKIKALLRKEYNGKITPGYLHRLISQPNRELVAYTALPPAVITRLSLFFFPSPSPFLPHHTKKNLRTANQPSLCPFWEATG